MPPFARWKELGVIFPIPKPECQSLEFTPFIKPLFHLPCGDGLAFVPLVRNHLQRIGIDRDEIMPPQNHQQVCRGVRTDTVNLNSSLRSSSVGSVEFLSDSRSSSPLATRTASWWMAGARYPTLTA